MTDCIVWFRRDLRLDDNPALNRAVSQEFSVFPIFIQDDDGERPWSCGEASRWWLYYALVRLNQAVARHGGQLEVCLGDPEKILTTFVRKLKVKAVYWNRIYDPAAIARDARIKRRLKSMGIEVETFNGGLLKEPWEISTNEGRAYRVFTPFSRTFRRDPLPGPVSLPRKPAFSKIDGEDFGYQLDSLHLLPKVRWDAGLQDRWDPRRTATEAFDLFLADALEDYGQMRDFPAHSGTSRLSPYLHFGEISPRRIFHKLDDFNSSEGAQVFSREIIWREFAHHVLYHFPDTPEQPLQPAFSGFPWISESGSLKRWQQGMTGYPIVDAGMRELWQTGWMHNRVRMIVASFLVKHLLHSWQDGARWFWDTLVDADLANNTMGWQWAGGCGADAAPYFRIFNPVLQGKKFDPNGEYTRRYVPELSDMPDKFLHEPWTAPDSVRRGAGVKPGDYPDPIVDHKLARERALKAFATIKGR